MPTDQWTVGACLVGAHTFTQDDFISFDNAYIFNNLLPAQLFPAGLEKKKIVSSVSTFLDITIKLYLQLHGEDEGLCIYAKQFGALRIKILSILDDLQL